MSGDEEGARISITVGLTLAALAVPAARAGDATSYIGHPGGPGAAGPVIAAPTDSYIGHAGGPGSEGPVLLRGDAAVGGGFVAGLALLGLGAAMTLRRRTTQAQLKF